VTRRTTWGIHQLQRLRLGTRNTKDKVELRLKTPCSAVISKSSIAREAAVAYDRQPGWVRGMGSTGRT
jgi:hypothetical protein